MESFLPPSAEMMDMPSQGRASVNWPRSHVPPADPLAHQAGQNDIFLDLLQQSMAALAQGASLPETGKVLPPLAVLPSAVQAAVSANHRPGAAFSPDLLPAAEVLSSAPRPEQRALPPPSQSLQSPQLQQLQTELLPEPAAGRGPAADAPKAETTASQQHMDFRPDKLSELPRLAGNVAQAPRPSVRITERLQAIDTDMPGLPRVDHQAMAGAIKDVAARTRELRAESRVPVRIGAQSVMASANFVDAGESMQKAIAMMQRNATVATHEIRLPVDSAEAPILIAHDAPASEQQVLANTRAQTTSDFSLPQAPAGESRWNDALAGRVQWMIKNDLGEAKLRLDPPELGSVEIKLSVVDDRAYVQLSAAQSATRDALEAAIPRLKELLGDVGLQLGGANVSAENAGQQPAPLHGRQFTDGARQDLPAHETVSPNSSSRSRNDSRIDLYA